MKIDRKDFLKSALVIAGSGFGLTEGFGCGSDGATTGTGGSGTGTGGSGTGGQGTGGQGTGGRGTGGQGTGGQGTGGGGGTNACMAAPTATVGTNHGHSLTVPLADITTGTTKTYSIMGTSAHDHMITITAAQFTMLRAGTMYMMTSTTGGGHTHAVTINCA